MDDQAGPRDAPSESASVVEGGGGRWEADTIRMRCTSSCIARGGGCATAVGSAARSRSTPNLPLLPRFAASGMPWKRYTFRGGALTSAVDAVLARPRYQRQR